MQERAVQCDEALVAAALQDALYDGFVGFVGKLGRVGDVGEDR
jgi:hypothetical protein